MMLKTICNTDIYLVKLYICINIFAFITGERRGEKDKRRKGHSCT